MIRVLLLLLLTPWILLITKIAIANLIAIAARLFSVYAVTNTLHCWISRKSHWISHAIRYASKTNSPCLLSHWRSFLHWNYQLFPWKEGTSWLGFPNLVLREALQVPWKLLLIYLHLGIDRIDPLIEQDHSKWSLCGCCWCHQWLEMYLLFH